MADGYISQIKTPDNKVYLLKDSESIRRNSELLTTNPFAPASLRGPYISKIDNAFYAADKRWQITATNLSYGGVEALFDGNYETQARISGTDAAVITMDFDPEHTNVAEKNKYFPGYPYGYILISFYSTAGPASISGRVYCNYSAQGIGWHDLTFSPISDNTTYNIVYRSEHQGYYNMAVLEITINGNTSNSYGYTSITQIEMHLDRPSSNRTPFLSKYSDETLYYNLTAPKFIGSLQGNANTATKFSSTRKIELTGAVTGSATTDGSSGWTISTTVNHNHDSIYSYIHLTDYDFTDTRPLSKYVTFDKSKPVGAPREEWYNGFISSHSNYHASYIINGHTHQDEWYVGHGIWKEANTPHAPAPTWYLLAHSGNVGTGDNNGQVKIAGVNISVKGLKALAYKDSLAASDIPDIGNTYLKLSGGTMTGDIEGNASVALGTTTHPFHNIVLGGATNATLTADSTNPRITFQESNNGTQPVHLIYSDYDSYRSPAGLKIIGGTDASPAWLEVEGNIYAAAFKGNADTATNATYAANAANTQSNYGAKSFIVEGDADTYYPVIISGYTSHGAWTLLNISRDYAEQAPDTWNTSTHKGGLVLTILSNGDSAWGGNHNIGINKLNTILDLSQEYSIMVADMRMTNFGLVIWLRGGSAKYWITSNGGRSVTVTPKYEEYTANSNTIAPCTDINTARLNSFRWNNLWTIKNATNATTATNLANNPSIQASTSNDNQITITAGGKTSDAFTVPYATSADTATSANRLSQTAITSLSSFTHTTNLIYAAAGGSNSVTDKPSGVDAFGVLSYKTADGWYGQILTSSNTSSGIYWRTGTTLSGGWKKLLDSDNTAAGTNNAATLAWSTTYTIAKINNVDIKFTTMAKPSYTFTDLTAHPTTLSGYGITDAAAKNHSHTLKIGNKSLSVSTNEQEWTVHDILYNTNIIEQSTSWDIITPGIYAVTNSSHDGSGHPGSTAGQTAPYPYGHLIVTRANGYGAAQIYISHVASGPKAANKGIRYRSGWNVNSTSKTEAERWQEWATILDDKNFNLYAPTLTGTGASGSWSISITGTAAKATADASGNTITSTYAPLASPALTGTPTAPTAANGTNTTQIATTAFVNNTLSYVNAMRFKGTLGTGGTITTLPASHEAGDTYRVITAGTWAGNYCEVGTLIICVQDGNTASDTDWTSVETNEDGAVIGPTSSTNNTIVRWDGSSGRIIKNTNNIIIDDNGNTTIGNNSVASTLTVYGATILSSTLGVSGATTLSSTLSVADNSTLTGKVGIGASPDNNYQLYVNGNSQFNGNLIPTITNNNADKTLGSSDNRWAKLYIGNADNHGDAYTPVYWNDGVPTEVTLVQQCAFTIKSGMSGVKLSHAAITVDSYVTEIVITSGESKLNSAISWTSAAGYIELTCSSTVSGDVTGYIMISRGGEITATATDIT